MKEHSGSESGLTWFLADNQMHPRDSSLYSPCLRGQSLVSAPTKTEIATAHHAAPTRSIIYALIIVSVLLPITAQAHSIWVAPGVTSEGGATASVGMGRDWNRRWFESNTGHLGGYWHLGYSWWEGGRAGDAAQSVSFSPVLVYTFNAENWRPFLEAGVGAALFSRSLVGDKDLGSSAHFEDRFGAGVLLGERDRLML